LNFSNP